MMITTTLYKVIQSELIKAGHSEFEEEEPSTELFPFGKFAYYNEDYQITEKILKFDNEIMDITDELFMGVSLQNKEHDNHFKKMFILRFVNRQINRQTIEAFKMELLSTFMSHQDYISRVYDDLDKYITQTQIAENTNIQTNKQKNDGSSITDNRSAFADLPQSNVNLDVDNSNMSSATDNTIARNRQTDTQQTDGETTGVHDSKNKSYQFDNLIKSNSIMENIMLKFDRKCFLQVW